VTSILDGFGTGFGFTLAIVMLATVREVLADGAWLGFRVLPDWWVPWTVMKLPAGAFITLGFMLAAIVALNARKQARAQARARKQLRTAAQQA